MAIPEAAIVNVSFAAATRMSEGVAVMVTEFGLGAAPGAVYNTELE
jgi:hypothetical protein